MLIHLVSDPRWASPLPAAIAIATELFEEVPPANQALLRCQGLLAILGAALAEICAALGTEHASCVKRPAMICF